MAFSARSSNGVTGGSTTAIKRSASCPPAPSTARLNTPPLALVGRFVVFVSYVRLVMFDRKVKSKPVHRSLRIGCFCTGNSTNTQDPIAGFAFYPCFLVCVTRVFVLPTIGCCGEFSTVYKITTCKCHSVHFIPLRSVSTPTPKYRLKDMTVFRRFRT